MQMEGYILAFSIIAIVAVWVFALVMPPLVYWLPICWQYGKCHDRVARRNCVTGEVQFILWAKGDKQGDYVYTEDYWHRFDPSWWPEFKANK